MEQHWCSAARNYFESSLFCLAGMDHQRKVQTFRLGHGLLQYQELALAQVSISGAVEVRTNLSHGDNFFSCILDSLPQLR